MLEKDELLVMKAKLQGYHNVVTTKKEKIVSYAITTINNTNISEDPLLTDCLDVC